MNEKQVKVPFEEALNKTGFGKYNYFMTALCGSLVTSMVFEGQAMSFLVPASACELDTTVVQQGLMAGLPLIGVIATSHMWGYLADTRGRRPVLTVSLLLGCTTGFISSLSPNWIVLSILKLVSCSSVSGTYALAMTLLSECTPEAKRSTMVILTTGLFMAANGIMAVLVIPILPLTFSYYIPVLNIHYNSWRLLAMVYTIPCALGALGIYSTWESPKYLLSAGKEEEAIEVLKKIYAWNHGSNKEGYQIKSIVLDELRADEGKKSFWSSIVSQTIPILKPPLLKNTILLSAIFVVIYLCTFPYFTWLPTVADSLIRAVQSGEKSLTFCQLLQSSQNVTVVEETKQCILNSYAMIGVFAVSLLIGFCNTIVSSVISFVGRRRFLITVQIVAGICGLTLNFSTNWILSAVLFITFILSNVNFGVVTTFTVDIYPTYLRAMAVCLSVMVGRASAVVGINIVKSMLIHNCEMSFYIFGSITIAGAVVSFFLPPDK